MYNFYFTTKYVIIRHFIFKLTRQPCLPAEKRVVFKMTRKMTAIKKRPGLYWYKDGNVKKYAYRYRYNDIANKRKEVSKSNFETEEQAYNALLTLQIEVSKNSHKALENGDMTISDWLDLWIESKKSTWAKTTMNTNRKIVDGHLKRVLGSYKLKKLSRELYISKYINVLLETHAPQTVEKHNALFNTAINAAVESELLDRNRFRRITIKNTLYKKKYFEKEELKIISDHASDHWNMTHMALVKLLMVTGCRIGEALGLRWGNIDFDKKTVTISTARKAISEYNDEHFGALKSKNSYRTLTLTDDTIDMLRAYKKYLTVEQFKNGKKVDDSTMVFIEPRKNRELKTENTVYIFKCYSRDLGFRVTAHMFRHTVASILLSSGESIASVADYLGDTQETVIKYYSHVLKDDKKKVGENIERAIRDIL